MIIEVLFATVAAAAPAKNVEAAETWLATLPTCHLDHRSPEAPDTQSLVALLETGSLTLPEAARALEALGDSAAKEDVAAFLVRVAEEPGFVRLVVDEEDNTPEERAAFEKWARGRLQKVAVDGLARSKTKAAIERIQAWTGSHDPVLAERATRWTKRGLGQ